MPWASQSAASWNLRWHQLSTIRDAQFLAIYYVILIRKIHGSLNVPIEHHPTIRYMVYNGYYKVMFNIPKMGHLMTPGKLYQKMINHWGWVCTMFWQTHRDRCVASPIFSGFISSLFRIDIIKHTGNGHNMSQPFELMMLDVSFYGLQLGNFITLVTCNSQRILSVVIPSLGWSGLTPGAKVFCSQWPAAKSHNVQ